MIFPIIRNIFLFVGLGLCYFHCSWSQNSSSNNPKESVPIERWSCAIPVASISELLESKPHTDCQNPHYYVFSVAYRGVTGSKESMIVPQRCHSSLSQAIKADEFLNRIVIESFSMDHYNLSSSGNPKRNFSERGVVDCCPLDPRTGKCNANETPMSESCLCVLYAHYPAGQNEFNRSFLEENREYIKVSP